MVKYLSADDVLAIHDELVKLFEAEGDPIAPPGPRDRGLVETAANRPRTALGGTEKYESIEAKAAALFHSLVMNHAFHNGNKRTALVSLLVFLDQNQRLVDVSDDELFDFVLAVAENRFKQATATGHADEVVDAIRSWIGTHSTERRGRASNMKLNEFLKCVESAGGTYRRSGGGESWIVAGTSGKPIRISRSTRELDGNVVRNYLTKLGLSTGQSGIYLDEFTQGVPPTQAMIRRFRAVLKKLAHA